MSGSGKLSLRKKFELRTDVLVRQMKENILVICTSQFKIFMADESILWSRSREGTCDWSTENGSGMEGGE